VRCILTLSQSYPRPARISLADSPGKVRLISKHALRSALLVLILAVLAALSGCEAEPRKTDAELGLNPQEAMGRRVYDARCAECHYAYSSRDLRGPSLHGLFKKQFMSSGIPANDERVIDIIEMGRAKMPGFQNKLTVNQVADLMTYLHTL
jgi:mono/diheme cytochrome c family protein